MIQVQHVGKSFGSFQLLKDINLTVEEGEKVSILGPGGCGKTTLLKMILGLEPPSTGEIKLMDCRMDASSERERQQTLRHVGVAFQQGALFDYMTVEDNLKFAMTHMTDFDDNEMAETTQRLLDGVKLSKSAKLMPYELSGGMQRRIGIARALATDPTVAIFDEPTAGLDPVTSTIILNMIHSLGAQKPQNTLIIATSTVEIGIRFAERIILMKEGEIVADGPWRDLVLHGSDWVKHFLTVRLIGTDINYVREMGLPEEFIRQYW